MGRQNKVITWCTMKYFREAQMEKYNWRLVLKRSMFEYVLKNQETYHQGSANLTEPFVKLACSLHHDTGSLHSFIKGNC